MTATVRHLMPYGRLLSPVEAQQHLGIPASTIRTWHQRRATSGLYAGGLLGRAPLFYEADLIAAKRGLRIRNDQGDRVHTLADLREVDETPIR
jgi:hypothetical protein